MLLSEIMQPSANSSVKMIIVLALTEDLSFQDSKKVKETVQEELRNKIYDITINSSSTDSFTITVGSIKKTELDDLKEIEDTVTEVFSDILSEYENDIGGSTVIVELTGLPPQPVHWDGEILFQCQHEQKITGIHKLIFDADNLTIGRCQNIEGGVLGILRLDTVKKIHLSGTSKPWMNIIRSHFAGDRDVIDCQQELIDAGLKQYANF